MIVNCKQCLKFIDNKCSVRDIEIIDGRCKNEIRDSISYQQHRMYRGLLLPAICEAMGETNNNYVHEFILKPEWIERKTGERELWYSTFDDIPKKYQESGGARIFRINPCNFGVVPSMSTFTKQETKEYFTFCDYLLHIELNEAIQDKEYYELKARLLK